MVERWRWECGALQEGGELEVGRVEHWLRGWECYGEGV